MKYNLRNILGRHLGRAVEKLPTERKALVKTYLRQIVEETDVHALRNDLADTFRSYEGSSLTENIDTAKRELRRIKRQVGPGSWEYNWKPMLQELLDED